MDENPADWRKATRVFIAQNASTHPGPSWDAGAKFETLIRELRRVRQKSKWPENVEGGLRFVLTGKLLYIAISYHMAFIEERSIIGFALKFGYFSNLFVREIAFDAL